MDKTNYRPNLYFNLLDPAGNLITSGLKGVISARYTKVLGGVGVLSMTTARGGFDDFDEHIIQAVIQARIGRSMYRVVDSEFIIKESGVTTSQRSGDVTQQLVGVDHNVALENRVIAYLGGTSETVKSGPADDVMKELVEENLGSSSTSGSFATDTDDRYITDINIDPDTSAGPTVNITGIEEQNLLRVLLDIQAATLAAGSEVFFGITLGGSSGRARFRTAVGLWGRDQAGAVVFSVPRGNLTQPAIRTVKTGAVTDAYAVGASGLGSASYRSVSSSQRYSSEYTRREGIVSVGSSTSDDEIDEAGRAYLAANRPVTKFEGVISAGGVTPYALPLPGGWNIGDRVTCYAAEGVAPINPIVRAVQVSLSESGELDITARVESSEVSNG